MIITFCICLVCWILGYYVSLGYPVNYNNLSPVWKIFVENIFINKVFTYSTGILFLLFVTFLIQRIGDVEMLVRERTRLPFLLFLLFYSSNFFLLPVTGAAIAVLCLVLMTYELFKAYHSPESTGHMFNAGLALGIAGLFIPQTILYLAVLWLGMYQFRSINIKTFLASLIGYMMIFWFVFGYCFWIEDFSCIEEFTYKIVDISLFQMGSLTLFYKIGLIVLLIFFVSTFFKVKMDSLNNSVRVRMMLSFLLNMSIFTICLIVLYGKYADSFVVLLYFPSSILGTYFLEKIKINIRFMLYYSILILFMSLFMLDIWNS
jgi:hypothetical protein